MTHNATPSAEAEAEANWRRDYAAAIARGVYPLGPFPHPVQIAQAIAEARAKAAPSSPQPAEP